MDNPINPVTRIGTTMARRRQNFLHHVSSGLWFPSVSSYVMARCVVCPGLPYPPRGITRKPRSEKPSALFANDGDTVNTTARIERSSEPGRIQLSKEVGDLLLEFGKDAWIEPREQNVVAKGKGILHTFWLVDFDEDTTRRTDDPFPGSDIATGSKLNSLAHKSDARLIEWNVSLLVSLLKKIVAFREKVGRREDQGPAQEPFELDEGRKYFEEVQEVIELPQSYVDISDLKESEVELPAGVVEELRQLVATIASLYNANSFHSLEVLVYRNVLLTEYILERIPRH